MPNTLSYIDSHIHLCDARLRENETEFSLWLGDGNFSVTCATEESEWGSTLESTKHPQITGTIGVHPWFADGVEAGWEKRLEKTLRDNNTLGVGECGLDKLHCVGDIAIQKEVFKTQCVLAKKYNRALVMHCVKSWSELFEIIDDIGIPECGAILHSFGSSEEIAQELIKRRITLSFNLSLLDDTRKKHQRVFQSIPFRQILLETDSPDQLPKRIFKTMRTNKPQNIVLLYEKCATLRNCSVNELQEVIYENVQKIFQQQ